MPTTTWIGNEDHEDIHQAQDRDHQDGRAAIGSQVGGGGAKRYHTILDNASPVGFPINGDDNDKKWH